MHKKISDTYLQNTATVLEYLYRTPETSRIEISKQTGLTPAAITSIVGDLVERKAVIETGAEINGGTGSGRKRKVIQLNRQAGLLVGIEINMKGIFATLTDMAGNCLSKAVVSIDDYAATKINETIVNLLQEVLQNQDERQVCGAGIAVPGHFDRQEQTIISNNHQWQHFNLSKIKNEFSFPFIADNNIECMALGEYLFNPLVTPENFLFFHIGAGMFCSFFQAGQLGFNDNYYIGEIGHTVVDINGPKCECGKRGCLQTYISDSWLLKNARFLFDRANNTTLKSLVDSSDEISLNTIINGYKLGDIYLNNQIDLGLKLLATSIANTLILQDAEKIYLNSELLNHEDFKEQITDSVKEQLSFIPTKRDTAIEIIPFDDHRGAHGAAALAVLSFFIRHPGYSLDSTYKKI